MVLSKYPIDPFISVSHRAVDAATPLRLPACRWLCNVHTYLWTGSVGRWPWQVIPATK